jgi:hypothetical protein
MRQPRLYSSFARLKARPADKVARALPKDIYVETAREEFQS